MKSVKYGDRYIIYENGSIYDSEREIYMEPKYRDKNNYARVTLKVSGEKKIVMVHRVIYEAFNGPIPDDMGIVHINKINDDNRLENLALETLGNIKKNTDHKKNNPNSKQCVSIDADGNEKVFSSIGEAAREIGENKYIAKNISSCLNGRTNTAYGFKWRWA